MKRRELTTVLTMNDPYLNVVHYGAHLGDERYIALTEDKFSRVLEVNEVEFLRDAGFVQFVHPSFLTDEERDIVHKSWERRVK